MTIRQRSSISDGRFLASGDEAGTAPDDRSFRPDVEGLRAVAVLLVVLYHAQVPHLTGGYVGVDVFFVISGFVITGLLLRERTRTGRTSFVGFYARRCRRILPAGTLVILTTVLATYVILGLVTGVNTADDGRWAAAFLANLHFETIGTSYLSSTRPPSPLQNFWSLSVEEQFYIIYPTLFVLVAATKARLSFRSRMALVLGIVIVLSYWLSIVQTASHPTAAYFSPLTRAWELALGGLVAVGTSLLKQMPSWSATVLTWAGLAAIIIAALSFNDRTAYPGSLVAVPVLGAAMIIAGGAATPRLGAEYVLGLHPFRWLGKLSYSLYLWHWPILIIAAERFGKSALPWPENLLLVLLGLIISFVTYTFIENPIRHSQLSAKQSVGLGLGLVAVTVVALSAVLAAEAAPPLNRRVIPAADRRTVLRLVAAADRIQAISPSLEPSLSSADKDFAGPGGGLQYGCASNLAAQAVNGALCTLGDSRGSQTMVAYGDSHILMWLPALDAIAASAHWRLVIFARYFCPAELVSVGNFPGFGSPGSPDTTCDAWHASVVRRIDQMQPALVIVSQVDTYGAPNDGGKTPPFTFSAWESGLARLINAVSLPHRDIVILGNIPVLPQSGPVCLAAHPDDVQECSGSVKASVLPLNNAERAAAASTGARYIDPTPWFCSSTCTAVVGDYDVYMNQHHVTATYAIYLQNVLDQALGFPPIR